MARKRIVLKKLELTTNCECGEESTLGKICSRCKKEVAYVLDYDLADVILEETESS